MKTMKASLLLVIGILVLHFTSCEKDKSFELGDTQTDFLEDSVYRATTDGLLLVQLDTDGMFSFTGAIIYGGDSDNPTDTIGHINPFGSLTLPIKNNTYWKASIYAPSAVEEYIHDLVIQWTPIY